VRGDGQQFHRLQAVTDADHIVPRLFERFERGSTGEGSGLGLAIAKAYVNAHGGELLYHPGRGGAA
jgi:two-component system, OmpR family, sensor kinase